MQSFSFGGEEHQRFEIAVLGYERDATGDEYDDNWLAVEISITAGAFRGRFSASIFTSDLTAFHEELVALYKAPNGSAQFRTMEEQVSLNLKGDGLGHIELQGEVLDQPGIGNRLSFSLSLDQTQVRASAQSLATLINAFPIRA